MNKQDRVFEVLRTNSDCAMSITEINIALHDILTNDYWLSDVIHRAAYRGKDKGIQIIKLSKGNFKYMYKTPPVPVELIEDPLDAVLERIQTNNKPIKEDVESDIFNDDNTVYENNRGTGDTNELFTPSKENLLGDVDCEQVVNTGIFPEQDTIPSREIVNHEAIAFSYQSIATNKPDPTAGNLIHLVQAYKPAPVTLLKIRSHFGITNKEAVALLLDIRDKGFPDVTVKISAVAR